MTPRSPTGKGRPTAVITGNPMDKYLDETKEIATLYATSLDPEHPPENILVKDFSFWNSTGLYPQEIVIALKEDTRIAELKTVTANVKKISIQRVIPKKGPQAPPEWKEVTTSELPQIIDQLQVHTHKLNNVAARFIKVVFLEGFDHTCAVYSVAVVNAEGKRI